MATEFPAPPAEDLVQIVLSGLAHGRGLDDLVPEVGTFASDRSLFPGDALLDLAADLIAASGATRDRPLDSTQMRRRHLPEDRATTRAQHQKAEFAIRAAAMIRGGVDPALHDTVSWWRLNDLWLWSLQAVLVYARAAAEHSEMTVADLCELVAERRGIEIGSDHRPPRA